MKSILLVDDDHVCNYIMQKTLERMKLAVTINAVLDGKQALDLLHAYSREAHAMPDIIFLDLNMPVMDGFQFLEAYSKLHLSGKQNIKIVVVSSSEASEDIQKAKALGAEDYLIKPASAEQLRVLL